MFGLFRRAPTAGVGSRRRVVLRLEGLEGRDQPSSLDRADGTVTLGLPSVNGVYLSDESNQAPQISNFSAVEEGNGLFLITGQVVDANPGGLVVTLGGSTSASGHTTTTLADGTFSIVIRLHTDGTDSGFITATTVDGQGVHSAPAQVFVNPTPP
jgi:hypothetical protein